jgi:pyruvate,water dikinase
MVDRRTLRAAVWGSLALAVLCRAPAASAQAAWSITPSRITAGTFYDGASIAIEGSVGAGSNLAIRVTGPLEQHVFNRRGRIAGFIWGGVEHVAFRHAPSLYELYTSAALPLVADQALRERLHLGYETLESAIEVEGTRADKRLLVEHFVRLKEHEGLYRVAPGAVHLEDVRDGRRRFHASIPVDDAAEPGDIEVTVLELAGGAVVRTETAQVRLARVGIPGFLYGLAHENGTLFGFVAVLTVLFTGLATNLLGDLRDPERRRRMGLVVVASARAVRDVFPGLQAPIRSFDEVERLHAKYQLFRNLLNVNNEVLGLLSELEEESSWASFRHPRVRMGIRALFDGTTDMVDLLNQLSGNRFFDLSNVVASIRRDVTEALGGVDAEESRPLTLKMEEISSKTAGLVGGKAVNLARLAYDLGLHVPSFFVITVEAYREFLEHRGLAGELRMVLATARLDDVEDLERRCELAQALIDRAEVPETVAEAIRNACRTLGLGPAEGVAVRSSAAGEDSELSFAGQFESVLNVREGGVVEAWKRVVRSRFSSRAVFYRRAAGLAEVDTPMAVLVQRMVPARASGVLFTRRPEQPKAPVLLISAVRGLGVDASAGTAVADELVVSRPPRRVLERRVPPKPHRLAAAAGGGVVAEPLVDGERLACSISDDEALRLAQSALDIEHHFSQPQDIEWAVDESGDLLVLQARPLRVEKADAPAAVAGTQPILSGGRTVWPGRAVGPVHVARSRDDESRLPTGAILVVPQLLPDSVSLLPRVCGIVVERGAVTGHAASIVREFRVPCLFGVAGALDTLADGQPISIDAASGTVYSGTLWPALRGQLPVTLQGRRAVGLPAVLAGKLTRLSGSMFMSSWTCQSLHDVIRFAHEMALQQMFSIGDRLAGSAIGGVRRLKCQEPVYLHVLDLGGGISPPAMRGRSVKPEDVLSLPFQGFWQGFADEGLERPDLEVPSGAFGAVVTGTLEGGTRPVDAPNYACVSANYLNLNSRQAYHFAVVDAFLSENENSNHISIRLKGGGAATWQRTLRAEFMADVLRLHQFNARVEGDLLNGWRRGVDLQTGMEKLRVVGHLLRFSAQLDLRLASEQQARQCVQTFVDAEAEALRRRRQQAGDPRAQA